MSSEGEIGKSSETSVWGGGKVEVLPPLRRWHPDLILLLKRKTLTEKVNSVLKKPVYPFPNWVAEVVAVVVVTPQ